MKYISNQSHQFSLDAALEGGLCKSSLEFGTGLTFISMTVAALERQISPCKNTLLYPLSREPAERSWDQYIPNKRLDLVYANKCQGVSLWISKSVIDLGCHSDI